MNRAISDKTSATNRVNAAVLESQILKLAKHYQKLTVRMLYYIMISRLNYPAGRSFYKKLNYRLVKMRRANPGLNVKFIDPTRHYVAAQHPSPFELWAEKDSVRTFLESLAAKYHVPIQVTHGFGSLSMFRKSLARASSKGIRRILYIGDFDPSGILIDKIASREMRLKLQRIALTIDQIKKYRLPSIQVNLKDSRAEGYIEKYGSRCWEVEALRPRTFWRLVEQKLRENVPHWFVVEADLKDEAAQIARPTVEKFKETVEQNVFEMLKRGKPRGEVLSTLAKKFGSLTQNRS